MINLKDFFGQALVKGESLRDEIATELLRSKALKEILKSDVFVRAISTIMRTKDEVAHAIRANVKAVLKLMDVPSKGDITHLERKIDQLEKVVDRVGKRTITVGSLKKIKSRRNRK